MSQVQSNHSPLISSEDPLGHLDYDLPAERIATSPISPRDQARLFVVRREGGESHIRVCEIERVLREGDLLIVNRARVMHARIPWKKPTGGEGELLLLRPISQGELSSTWEALVGGRNLKSDSRYPLPEGLSFRLLERQSGEGGFARIEISASVPHVQEWMETAGAVPLPPYILRERSLRGEPGERPEDSERYQTIFARQAGAVAAPTAGLHFSPELLASLKKKGVRFAEAFLAVGWGTFQPLHPDLWRQGKLFPEWVEIDPECAQALLSAKREGRRVVGVGTTVTRALEAWALAGSSPEGFRAWCDLLIRSPYKFRVLDALMTNFHLPRSSLLALVAAFFGKRGEERLLKLYRDAIAREYRFYSFGDAMLIL